MILAIVVVSRQLKRQLSRDREAVAVEERVVVAAIAARQGAGGRSSWCCGFSENRMNIWWCFLIPIMAVVRLDNQATEIASEKIVLECETG